MITRVGSCSSRHQVTSVRSPNVQHITSPDPLSGSAASCAITGSSTPYSGEVTVLPIRSAYRSSPGWAIRATQAAISPPDGVRSDLWVMRELAQRLGRPKLSDDPGEIFEELRRASAGGKADYAGITHQRIADEQGVFWPCPSIRHPGTPRLFTERFAHPTGLARFHPVEHRGSAEQPCADFPLILTTGRVMAQYQTGTQTRRVPELAAAEPAAFAEIHPDTARQHGIQAGDAVQLTTRRGQARMAARLTRDIRRDTVFMPFHWSGEGNANHLTIAALDPVSRIPEYKACAVRLDRAAASTGEAE